MDEAIYFIGSDGKYWRFVVNSQGHWQQTGSIDEGELPSGATVVDKSPSGSALNEGNSFAELSGTTSTTSTTEPIEPKEPVDPTGGNEWGAANITKDMFVDADGTQRTVEDIYEDLDPILTNLTGQELVNYINDLIPKYTGVPAEEKGFLAEQYGGATGVPDDPSTPDIDESQISFADSLSGRGAAAKLGTAERAYETAGIAKGTMLEGLQTKASQFAGGASGSGVGMRAKITGQAKIKKGFETGMGIYDIAGKTKEAAETAYGLAEAGGEFDYRTSMYDLEKTRTGAYERDVVGTFKTDFFGDPGEEAETTTWGTWRGGGRVPTFTEILSRIPDAGGS